MTLFFPTICLLENKSNIKILRFLYLHEIRFNCTFFEVNTSNRSAYTSSLTRVNQYQQSRPYYKPANAERNFPIFKYGSRKVKRWKYK